MNKKTEKILNWTLTGLVSFVFLGSAAMKLMSNEEALKMASGFGLDAKTYTMIAILELACLLLFVIPKTGVIGTFLLSAYMGGAIATHLEHGQSILAPCIIEAFVLIVAIFRFPELRTRFLNSKS